MTSNWQDAGERDARQDAAGDVGAVRRALAVPAMVIRGSLSDILTAQTVAAMRARRSSLDVVEVADQGHAPLLADAATIARIEAFVDRVS